MAVAREREQPPSIFLHCAGPPPQPPCASPGASTRIRPSEGGEVHHPGWSGRGETEERNYVHGGFWRQGGQWWWRRWGSPSPSPSPPSWGTKEWRRNGRGGYNGLITFGPLPPASPSRCPALPRAENTGKHIVRTRYVESPLASLFWRPRTVCDHRLLGLYILIFLPL